MTTESYTFTGRIRKPWYKKINPIWWVQNDDEQTVDQAPWYHGPDHTVQGWMGPEWSHTRRWIYWNIFRNPLQNFRAYVVGVQDRNYTVFGKSPVQTIQRNDLSPPETGYQWCVIKTLIPRPFISYSGTTFVWYLGWQYNGFFGFKFNIL